MQENLLDKETSFRDDPPTDFRTSYLCDNRGTITCMRMAPGGPIGNEHG
jgi:hypothetical protein